MASITIRNLDDEVKKRLRRRAADHGRSLEAEARDILTRSADTPPAKKPKTGLDLVQPLLDFSRKYGGVELEPFPDQVLAERPAAFVHKPRK
jgi:antitoxin FitA